MTLGLTILAVDFDKPKLNHMDSDFDLGLTIICDFYSKLIQNFLLDVPVRITFQNPSNKPGQKCWTFPGSFFSISQK